MGTKTEPIGGEQALPERSPAMRKLVDELYKQLRISRMKSEKYENPELAKGFSIQEQLDILTEQYGEDVVLELQQELAKPKRSQSDINNPSRALENVAIVTDPKTGDMHLISIWNTDMGKQKITDVFLDIYNEATLDAIRTAPADIREKILAFLKDAREKTIYPESGNDLRSMFIVRKNPSNKAGYSIFLTCGGLLKNVTKLVPENIRESIRLTGAGNADELLQKWIQGDEDAKKLKKEIIHSLTLQYLEKNTSISDLISQISEIKDLKPTTEKVDVDTDIHEEKEKERADAEAKEKVRIEAEATLDTLLLPEHLADLKKTLETRDGKGRLSKYSIGRITSLYEKWVEEERKKVVDADAEAKEKVRIEAEATLDTLLLPKHLDELKKILATKAGKDGLSQYSIDRITSLYEKWTKEEKEKAEEEAEKNAKEAIEMALKDVLLPPHLAEYKKFLEEQRGKKGLPLSEYDIQRITSLYEKWTKEEREKADAEAVREEAEKIAREEAEEKVKKAETANETEEEQKKDDEEEMTKKDMEEGSRYRDYDPDAPAPDTDKPDVLPDSPESPPPLPDSDSPGSSDIPPTPDTDKPETPPDGQSTPPDSGSPDSPEVDRDADEEDIPTEEGLTRLERLWQAARGLVRVATGTMATLFGVRFAQTAFNYTRDAWRLRGLKKDTEAIQDAFSELEYAQTQIAEATEKEGGTEKKTTIETAREKERAAAEDIERKIQDLIRRDILTQENAEEFRGQLAKILEETRKSAEGITKKTEKRIGDTLNTYIQRRTTGPELLKQGLNFGFVLTGLQTMRLFTYGGLSLYQRIQRRLAENEQLRTEGRETETQSIWRDLVIQAPSEFISGLRDTGTIVRDIFDRERVSQEDWTQQTQSSARALGNLALFAGMTGAVFSSGSIGDQIDALQQNYASQGLSNTIANNFTMNMERTTFGLVRHEWFDHPETPVVPPSVVGSSIHSTDKTPEAPVASGSSEARHEVGDTSMASAPEHHPLSPTEQTVAVENFAKSHTLLSANKLHIETNPDGTHHIDAPIGIHGHFQHIDQLLRRLAVDKMDSHTLHGSGTFDHIDAARVENVVANMRNALLGRGDTPLSPDQLHDIAHFSGGKLVIDNYEAFGKLTDRLLDHAQRTITEQSGALHYIDNTSHNVWQKMWDVKMQGEHQVPVDDFSAYHHTEPMHHTHEITPIHEHPSPQTEGASTEAPVTPITVPEVTLPVTASPEISGGASPFSTQDIPESTSSIEIIEAPTTPEDLQAAGAFPGATANPSVYETPTTADDLKHATPQTAGSASIGVHEVSSAGIEHWTATDFSQKFSGNVLDASFISAAHEHPDAFTLFFIDRLVELRHAHGADYYSTLNTDRILMALENSHFQKNISELINGVLLNKKDTIHLDIGYDATFHAQPKAME